MSVSSSSSSSPCAACKFLRRKCTQGCIFAPYFPPDNPARFAQVHRVFGASNVAKLLNDLTPAQREDAVNSLAYEAEARLHDPVYGCVGYISLLQHRLLQLQRDLSAAKKELSSYNQFYATSMAGIRGSSSASLYRDQQQQMQMAEAQQIAEAVAAARDHELMRRMEQQHEMARLMMDGNNVGSSATAAEDSGPPALVSPHIDGFEGSFAVLQQQQGGQFQEELSSARKEHMAGELLKPYHKQNKQTQIDLWKADRW